MSQKNAVSGQTSSLASLNGSGGHAQILDEYLSLLQSISGYLASKQVFKRTHDPKHVYFTDLSSAEQEKALSCLRFYFQALGESASASKNSFVDDKMALWAAIRRLGLRPPSDLITHLREDDLIELYMLPQYMQVYRNFLFFNVCSYTLDDIIARPWWQLYRRDEGINDRIEHNVRQLLKMRSPGVIFCDSGRHSVMESASEGSFISDCEHRILVPLFDSHKTIVAAVSCFRMYGVDSWIDGKRAPVWRPH